MANVIDILQERGFIEQTTHDAELEEHFQSGPVTSYIGFDPTASSLHIGSLVPIMALAHMQRNGHRPIALVGGGTGLVGDPSGKTEMRQLLTPDSIAANAAAIKTQLSRFIDFSEGKALLVNNADWLEKLEYIPFLRDIGRHFSVNRMLKAESYRARLESEEGLNFIEFNYMLLQAYDFLKLSELYDCRVQMGGSDQWGNIVAGVDLIRRLRQSVAYGITFPLITTSTGEKMGKTAKGAVWLDADRTSPYEYYQYWVNTDDRDVARFLALFTLLPMSEIREVEGMQGVDLNAAKAVLAYEATHLAHGRTQAVKAHQAAMSMFGNRTIAPAILAASTIPRQNETSEESVPHSVMDRTRIQGGIPAFKLLHRSGLAASGGAARRLIDQGGAYINGRRIDHFDQMITEEDVSESGSILLRSGKKKFHKIIIKD